MEDQYLHALADCVRIAVEKDYASDIITFDLDGNYQGFCDKFKEIFGEELYN